MQKNSILPNFIVFEGIDGTGKSTQITHVSQSSFAKQHSIHITREPSNGMIGKIIRQLLNDITFSQLSESLYTSLLAYLFAADRHEHLYGAQGILFHTNNKSIVISDRYLFSSLAYQKNTDIPLLVNMLNSKFPLPSLIFYFDLSPKEAILRMQHKDKDSMEKIEVLEHVHSQYNQIFQELASQYPDITICHIDASADMSSITQKIISMLSSHIQN